MYRGCDIPGLWIHRGCVYRECEYMYSLPKRPIKRTLTRNATGILWLRSTVSRVVYVIWKYNPLIWKYNSRAEKPMMCSHEQSPARGMRTYDACRCWTYSTTWGLTCKTSFCSTVLLHRWRCAGLPGPEASLSSGVPCGTHVMGCRLVGGETYNLAMQTRLQGCARVGLPVGLLLTHSDFQGWILEGHFALRYILNFKKGAPILTVNFSKEWIST
jgi:hypothetical protein